MPDVWRYKDTDYYQLFAHRCINHSRAYSCIQQGKTKKIIIRTKKIKDELAEKLKEEREKNLKFLNKEEKTIYGLLMKEGSMFQADLVDKSGFGKVKVTRILDRLEGKQIIERKRRGMNNIVISK